MLTSGGADRETLEVLAKSAKINKEEPPASHNMESIDLSTMKFNFLSDIPQKSPNETKMVIVVRSDGPYASLPIGLSAKLVSEAVMRAY